MTFVTGGSTIWIVAVSVLPPPGTSCDGAASRVMVTGRRWTVKDFAADVEVSQFGVPTHSARTVYEPGSSVPAGYQVERKPECAGVDRLRCE